jgi:hypothetical protein
MSAKEARVLRELQVAVEETVAQLNAKSPWSRPIARLNRVLKVTVAGGPKAT